jgi:hypothetical protein
MSKKDELLEAIQTERNHFEALIAPLSDEQMCQPALGGQRSVKDILAHITAWEQRCIGWIEAGLRGETPARPEPGYAWEDIDLLNEHTYLEHQHRPLQDVLADSHRSYQQLLEQVRTLSEEDLVDPERFPWTEGELLAWYIGANSFEHYHEHGDEIYAWLHSQK